MAPPARVVAGARAAAVVGWRRRRWWRLAVGSVVPAVARRCRRAKYTVTLGAPREGRADTLAGPVLFNVLHDPVATTTVVDRQANLESPRAGAETHCQIAAAAEAATVAKTKMDAIVKVQTRCRRLPRGRPGPRRECPTGSRDTGNPRRRHQLGARGAGAGDHPVVRQQCVARRDARQPTTTNREQYDIAAADFDTEYAQA